MRSVKISYTTATDGSATGTGAAVPGGGFVEAIEYLPGTTDTGATVTVADVYGGTAYTLWSKATAGTSNIRVYPRQLQVLNTDGSSLTSHTRMAITGAPKVTIASGGAAKAGSVIVWISDT